ncbi:MAG: cardiolipin synthase [Bacteroidia bacterium]|jgi:cardiolipin synthase
MLHYLPNALTTLRLLLVIPLCELILQYNFPWALAVGCIAGITDVLDGYFARKLQAFSRYGGLLDPIADKALIILSFLCLAQVELIPWYLAIVVIARDLIIITGAACYYILIGPFEASANLLSKYNMVVQVFFCALVLASAIFPGINMQVITYAGVAVIAIAAASGADYAVTWTRKFLVAWRRSSNG